MKSKLSGKQIELLLTMVGIGHWLVDARNFVDMANIVMLGMASPYDDDEGAVSCGITKKGQSYALKNKLVRPDKDAYFQPYTRTAKGEKFRKHSRP